VADLLGVDRITYARWENGESDVKSEFIPKIANILEVPIQDLFDKSATNINITSTHDNKDSATLNGAIIIITDKNAVDDLVKVLNDKLTK
jgi:transcriptional regulator with XRE-family HTH domain